MFFFFTFSSDNKRFNCTAVTLFLHTVPATNEAFIISRGELFSALLIQVRVICYHLSFHNCFHFAFIFKLWPLKILLPLGMQMIITWRRIRAVCGLSQGSLIKKLYAMDIYFLADPHILYKRKHLCFTLIVVAHNARWLNSFICSVTLLPVNVVALICLLHFHLRLTVFLP